MKLLVINGPNINMLGIREPGIYGKNTYADLLALIEKTAVETGIQIDHFQSNHEGAIVDTIQAAYRVFDGIVLNPAAYTHTSIATFFGRISLPLASFSISPSSTYSLGNFTSSV